MKNKSIIIISLVIMIAGSIFLWNYGYVKSYDIAYNLGLSEGNSTGYSEAYRLAYGEGYIIGNITGCEEGFLSGNSTGYQDGFDSGYQLGNKLGYDLVYNTTYQFHFPIGHTEGSSEGYDEGFVDGNESGLITGYSKGYYEGVIYDLRDPSLHEVEVFLSESTPETVSEIKEKAFDRGFRCFWVVINFPSGHVDSIAFNTTDVGIVFYNLEEHKIVDYTIGQIYYDRTKYYEPSFNDTIIGFEFVP